MAARVGGILEDARTGLMDIGLNDPSFFDGGKPMPIDLVWCDGGGCAGTQGFGNNRKGGIGLAPTLLGSYDIATGLGDPTSVLVTLHELYHQQQYTYGGLQTDPDGNWVWEGQARFSQDKVCMKFSAGNCTFSLDGIAGGSFNYIGEVNGYLGNPNRSVPNLTYVAALWWTYVTEKYGASTQEPDRGMDLMVAFWEKGEENINDDGIGTLNRALDSLGHTERFRDIFKDFAVASYAKDLSGPSVPSKYRYVDESQLPGPYTSVRLDLDMALGVGDQVGPITDDVVAWGARYYEVQPDPAVPLLNVEFRQDSANQVYYTLLAIKGDDIAMEMNHTGQDFVRTFANDDYDKVAVIVAGLDNFSNYRYAFNATQPVLRVLDPIQGRQAQAGDPSAPDKILLKVEVLSPVGGGTPVAGIDTDDFEITIGSQVRL
jgi:hypothetical protein